MIRISQLRSLHRNEIAANVQLDVIVVIIIYMFVQGKINAREYCYQKEPC